MAQDKKYSFITVGTDDDDDVVIQAGAPACQPAGFEPESAADLAEPEVEPAWEPEPALDLEPELAPAEDLGAAPEPEPEPEPALKAAPAPVSAKPKAKDGYRETTLEDLESAPMGSTQKLIIGIAVLGIAAFVAYYLFFM